MMVVGGSGGQLSPDSQEECGVPLRFPVGGIECDGKWLPKYLQMNMTCQSADSYENKQPLS